MRGKQGDSATIDEKTAYTLYSSSYSVVLFTESGFLIPSPLNNKKTPYAGAENDREGVHC